MSVSRARTVSLAGRLTLSVVAKWRVRRQAFLNKERYRPPKKSAAAGAASALDVAARIVTQKMADNMGQSAADLIATAKAAPGNIGSGGPGSPQHLAMALFVPSAGILLTGIAKE